MVPSARCLKWSVHSTNPHFLHNLVEHESVMVVDPGLRKLLLDILEVVVLKLGYVMRFEVLLVGADVPVGARLECAHEFEHLCERLAWGCCTSRRR